MATQVQLRRGTSTENDAFTGAQGELTFDTTNKRVRVHDGSAAGGFELVTEDGSGNITTGTVTADGLTVDATESYINGRLRLESGASSQDLRFSDTSTTDQNSQLRLSSGSLLVQTQNDAFNAATTRASFANNGDISFYEDTGTTAKFFWDASAEFLGLGTTSPDTNLHVYHATRNNVALIESGDADVSLYLKDGNSTSVSAVGIGATTDDLTLRAGNAERMRIDSSGNVGIGTSSPAFVIDAYHATDNGLARFSSGDADAYITISDVNSSSAYNRIGVITHDMYFNTNNAEAMRIDSSGNLLVGKTDTSLAVAGARILPTGQVYSTASGSAAFAANRLSSDGNIMELYKDTGLVGLIASDSGSMLLGSGDVGVYFDASSDRIIPMNMSTLGVRNDAIDLGGNPHRFKDLYLSGGVYLGGTGSSNPTNKLDDYEAGDFNASLTPASGSISVNASYNKLLYTKVGRLVTITGRIRIGSVSSASGAFYLTLPFTSINFAEEADFAALNLLTNGVDLDANVVSTFGEVNPNSTECYAYQQRDNNTWIALDASGLSAGDILYFAGTYTAA